MKTGQGRKSHSIVQLPKPTIARNPALDCTVAGMLARAAIYETLAFDKELPAADRERAARLTATLRDAARQMSDFLDESQRDASLVVLPMAANS